MLELELSEHSGPLNTMRVCSDAFAVNASVGEGRLQLRDRTGGDGSYVLIHLVRIRGAVLFGAVAWLLGRGSSERLQTGPRAGVWSPGDAGA